MPYKLHIEQNVNGQWIEVIELCIFDHENLQTKINSIREAMAAGTMTISFGQERDFKNGKLSTTLAYISPIAGPIRIFPEIVGE